MGGGPGNGEGAGRDPVQLLMDAERELRELASELQLRQEPFRDVTAWDARRVWKALDRVRQVLGDGEARSRLADVLSWVTSADIRMGNKIYKACEERCGEITKGAKDKEFEKCIDKCWESELQAERERQEASKYDAYIEPHPAALADLDELGIHWHRRWRRRG
jgi:hypothetical protein